MKILSISNYFPAHTGGIEFVALNLVSRLRRNHTVWWAACDVVDHPHQPHPDDVVLPASNFTEMILGFPYPLPSPSALLKILKQVSQADIIHVHDCLYVSNLTAFLASRLYHKPIVVTQHVGLVPYKQKYKNFLQKLAYKTLGKLFLANADQVVFISSTVKKWFEIQLRFKRTALLIPNGIDNQLFYPANPDERENIRQALGLESHAKVLLFVGRFTEKKGVNKIRKMAALRTTWTWLLVGNGELHPNEWNLSNVRVTATVTQKELRQYYIASDLFIIPSQGEGFPLVAQEALACGLPVALAEETASAFLNAPLVRLNVFDIQAMLTKLDKIIFSPPLLEKLRKMSIKYAQNWDWETVVQQYEELFNKILQNSNF